MSAGIGDLVCSMKVNSQAFKSGLSESMASMRSFVKGFAVLAAPIGGALALGHSVEAAQEQIGAQKRLSAVLEATGHSAGFSDKALFQFASDLQKTTNFADETTISAMSMLATFKNIRGDTFKQAVKSAQDLSTIMGTDLPESTRLIGKALSDPLRGIQSLHRAGVSLSQDQQAQIKQMMDAGNLKGAQGVILAGLKGSFGGAAEALASPLTQVKNVINDVAENIGMAILPSLKVVASTLSDWIGPAGDAREMFQEIGAQIASVVTWELALADALGGPVVTALGQTKTLFESVFVTGTVGASALADVWNLASDNMVLGLMKLVPSSERYFRIVGVYGAATWEAVSAALSAFWEDTKNIWTDMVGLAKAVGGAIGAALSAAFNLQDPIAAASDAFSAGLAQMRANAKDMKNPIAEFGKAWSTTVADATQGLQDQGGMKNAIQAGRDQLDTKVKDVLAQVPKGPEKPKTPEQKFGAGQFGSGGTGAAKAGQQSDLKLGGLTKDSRELQEQIVKAMRGEGQSDAAERTAAATEKIAANTDPREKRDSDYSDGNVVSVSSSSMDF